MTGTSTLRTTPTLGLLGWGDPRWTNNSGKDHPLNQVSLVEVPHFDMRNNEQGSLSPSLGFDSLEVAGCKYLDYEGKQSYDNRQKREKAHQVKLAREYTWGIFVGKDASRSDKSLDQLQELVMKRARRLSRELLGWFGPDKYRFLHEVDIASTLRYLNLVPSGEDPSLVTRRLAQASELVPIDLRKDGPTLTITLENGYSPPNTGNHYQVRRRK